MVMMVMDKLARARTSKRHRVRVRRSVRVEPMKSIERIGEFETPQPRRLFDATLFGGALRRSAP